MSSYSENRDCPRCGGFGTLEHTEDDEGTYDQCLLCGYTAETHTVVSQMSLDEVNAARDEVGLKPLKMLWRDAEYTALLLERWLWYVSCPDYIEIIRYLTGKDLTLMSKRNQTTNLITADNLNEIKCYLHSHPDSDEAYKFVEKTVAGVYESPYYKNPPHYFQVGMPVFDFNNTMEVHLTEPAARHNMESTARSHPEMDLHLYKGLAFGVPKCPDGKAKLAHPDHPHWQSVFSNIFYPEEEIQWK